MSLAQDLSKIVKGDVKKDAKTLKKFSCDASMFEVWPKVVVSPKNTEDVKSLVKYASGHESVSLTPRAGGTDMSGGALTESVVVDFSKYLNKFKGITSGSATAEPGMYYRDFEKETLRKGLIMPSYPASREICAVGGMVGNNAGGEKTLSYGKTEDYVQSLKVVLADGNEYDIKPLGKQELEEKISQGDFEGKVYKEIFELVKNNYDLLRSAKPDVSKNSAGYYLWNIWDKETGIFDLTKLFVGSQGTLGITTEITFRLVKPKKQKKLLVIFLRDQNKIADIVNEVLKSGPESFESYDDKTLKLVFSYFGDFVKSMGVGNVASLAFKFLPEVKMVLTGGFPRLVLMAEFTGDSKKDVETRIKEAQGNLDKFSVSTHIVKDETEAKKYWTIRRKAFSLLRSHLKNKKSIPVIDDLIVRPEKLPEFLPRLYAILKEYEKEMTYAVGGHSGDGNLHVYSIMDIADPSARKIIPEVSEKVYDLVIEMGGSITAEHNDGIIRSPYLEKMYGERVYNLFRETKNIFDPKKIFNPGKKIDASLGYSFDHIRKD